MTEQPIIEVDVPPETESSAVPRPVRATPRSTPRVTPEVAPAQRKKGFFATLDVYLLFVAGILLAIGMMMVYSTTFDWSYQRYGSQYTIFIQHVRNEAVGLAFLFILAFINYRVWR